MTTIEMRLEGRTCEAGWSWRPSDLGALGGGYRKRLRSGVARDGGSRLCRLPRELLTSFGIPSSGMKYLWRGSDARESYFELTMKKSIYQYASKSKMEKPR